MKAFVQFSQAFPEAQDRSEAKKRERTLLTKLQATLLLNFL